MVREHLNIDPNHAFDDPSEDAEEFYESRITDLKDRNGYYGDIAAEMDLSDQEGLPIIAVHLIPAETFGSDHNRVGTDLPEPPGFRWSGHTEWFGDFVQTADSSGQYDDEPFLHYSCFHEDGWAEAINVTMVPKSGEKELLTTIDESIVDFVEDSLDWYREVGISPPIQVYLTILNASDYTIRVPDGIWGPDHQREIGTDEFQFGEVTVETLDADVPELLRKPLDRLWSRTGWSRSINYSEVEEEGGNVRYEWDP